MRTEEDLRRLKMDWLPDRTWDIEETEGFEDHYDELLAYRESKEAQWEAEVEDDLRRFACKVNIVDNPVFARYIQGLEAKINRLETKLDRLENP